jgi:polyribonucleotide nucleotidyltransferase
MMVEAGAREVSEDRIAEALAYAHQAIQPAIELQKQLVEKVGVTAKEYELSLPSEDIQKAVDTYLSDKMGANIRAPYTERHEKMHVIREDLLKHFEEGLGGEAFALVKHEYADAFATAANKDVRKGIVEEDLRPDGRKFTEIRPLSSEVGLLPRAHGSSLFTRGMTQGLNVVTLAPLSYAQMVDTMEHEGERRYIHHYNAPAYTVGDIRRLGSPGRREIGHGAGYTRRSNVSVHY